MHFQTTRQKFHGGINKILGTGMGQRTSVFLKGMFWTMPASFISRLLTGLTTIYVARYLGPEGYGIANLSLAAALWIQAPLFLGLPTAIMHFIPQSSAEEKDTKSSMGLALLLSTSGITLLVCFLLRSLLARSMGLMPHVLTMTLIWCAGFSLYTTASSLANAEESFSRRAWIELFFAVGFVIMIEGLIHAKSLGPGTYIASYGASYALVGFWGLRKDILKLPKLTLARVRKSHFTKELLTYGLIASAGSVIAALFMAPARLLTNRYLTHTDVGILSAYQSGSVQMSLFVVWIGVQVFFPLASRTPNKEMLFKKINRVLWISAAPMVIAFSVLLLFYFRLLGSKYPLTMSNVWIYSVAAFLSLVFGILSWFFAAMGQRGMVYNSANGIVAGIINTLACYLLIPQWGVAGAGIANAAGSLVGIVGCYIPAARFWSIKQGAFELPEEHSSTSEKLSK